MDHAPDLSALHDALGCATAAVAHAWRGDRASASLSLIEAHAAAEEAFGCGSPEVDALDLVFAAITPRLTQRPNGRPWCSPTTASVGPIPLRTGEDLP